MKTTRSILSSSIRTSTHINNHKPINQQQQQQSNQIHFNWFQNHQITPYTNYPSKSQRLARSTDSFQPVQNINISSNGHHHHHHHQPIRYPAYPTHPSNQSLPKLTASIASFHNAALVYLHRGIAIESFQNQSSSSSQKIPVQLINSRPDQQDQEPFLSAIIKGFNQILSLETGLEFSQPRQVMEALMRIVRKRLKSNDDKQLSPHQQSQDWKFSKPVIIHSALRPRMSCVGDWAWEEIRRGNYNRLIEVWSGILEIIDQKYSKIDNQQSPTTIGLDQGFFTALVVVSSAIENGPKLSHFVPALVDRIWSRVQSTPHLQLERLPDPDRARYFLRAVELGLMWRRPIEDEQEQTDLIVEQDQRILHLIRRTFLAQQPQSLQYCIDISKRIQEAVNGSKDEPGWLTVDWSEPSEISSSSSTLPSSTLPQESLDSQAGGNRREMILTKNVIGMLIGGFAEHGLMEQVEELICFSKQLGGMSRYLWSSLLRGLAKQNKPDLMQEFVNRMRSEDQLEADFNTRCILISSMIGADINRALQSIDNLLLEGSSSSSLKITDDSKLPVDAINSIISGLLRHGLLERAERLMTKLSDRMRPNATTLNHFLNYHSRLQLPELAAVLGHLKLFESLSVKPDVVSFTILLNVLMKLGHGQEVVGRLLGMMEEMGIEPNAITYGSIIHHLCRSGRIEDVEVAYKLLDEIELRGIATTDITYTALIQGFLRAHIQEYENATRGIHPIRSNGEGEQKTKLETASELISRLKSRSSTSTSLSSSPNRGKINQVIYNSLLNALFSTGEIESGFEVFKLMKSEYDVQDPRDRFQVYGNGLIDSYGIIFRRLIQLGQFQLFRTIYHDYFLRERFEIIPPWIERLIDRFERSQT